MDNLGKFPTSTEAGVCEREILNKSYAAAGAGKGDAGDGDICSNSRHHTSLTVKSTPTVSAHTSSWLAALHVSNNNNAEKSFSVKEPLHKSNYTFNTTTTTTNDQWPCDSCDTYQKNSCVVDGAKTSSSDTSTLPPRVTLNEEDEGGGSASAGAVNFNSLDMLPLSYNGPVLASASSCNDATATKAAASFHYQTETDYDGYDMCGAVSLSPPLLDDPFAISATGGAGIGGGHSNRTSLNNSTENLSYISDNFYGDDLILLEEDIDVEAEELSLNSDDCIYAYRGEGADFDAALPPLSGVSGGFGLQHGNNAADEETDFLEMDFEPDPLSELEYNQAHMANKSGVDKIEEYLMQRESCHLVTPTQRRQLFSSPTDDLAPAPKALQAQSLLTKNFARITLHLDQIQKDYNDEQQCDEGRERLNSALDSRPLEEEFASDALTTDTSHSLPNTLHEHFTNRCNSESAVVANTKENALNVPMQTLTHKSPSKITGAKPKRLSTFSSTSSTSSKNSSKSRNSLRSAFQTSALGNNCSFDERSVSCSEFRTERDLNAISGGAFNNSKTCLLSSTPHTAPSTAAILNSDFNAFSDETCLDCLEKEFLANTIGKALDPLGCSKCRKRLGHLSLYNTTRSTTSEHSRYRRSASPTTTFFFNDQPSPTSRLFSCEFLNSQARKRQEWESYAQEHQESALANIKSSGGGGGGGGDNGTIETPAATITKATKIQTKPTIMVDIKDLNQSLNNLETKLLTNVKPPDPCSVTVPTLNLSETFVFQALDKLQIIYNKDCLKTYLKKSNAAYYLNSSSTNISKTLKEFKNLKDFLMYVSKRQANYLKLQKVIEKATQKQVTVQFIKDSTITDLEMVSVRVTDILYYWSQYKNIEILKDMDKRYQDTNILGKIAYIIRQAHQRSSCSTRRPLPEFISIPQYYPSGSLILTKKC